MKREKGFRVKIERKNKHSRKTIKSDFHQKVSRCKWKIFLMHQWKCLQNKLSLRVSSSRVLILLPSQIISQRRLHTYLWAKHTTLLWSAPKIIRKEKTSFQHYNSKTNLYPREKIHMFPHHVCCKYFSIVARNFLQFFKQQKFHPTQWRILKMESLWLLVLLAEHRRGFNMMQIIIRWKKIFTRHFHLSIGFFSSFKFVFCVSFVARLPSFP